MFADQGHQNGYCIHPPPSEISFVRGGPFYRFQQALRLIRPDRWNLGRRIIFLIAVGWLPLVLITTILNPDRLLSLLKEYRLVSAW